MITYIEVYELPDLPDNEEFNTRFPEAYSMRVEYDEREDDNGFFRGYIIEAYLGDIDVTEYLSKKDHIRISNWIEES